MPPTLTAWHVKYITHTVHLCCAIVYALAVKKKKRKTRGERKYDIQRVFCWEQAGCASDAGDPRKPCGRQGCLRCRSRGRKLPRKWGAYLLSSHPTCAHQPFKIFLFLLEMGIGLAIDFFWLHKILQKVQSLDNQQRQRLWLYGPRERSAVDVRLRR